MALARFQISEVILLCGPLWQEFKFSTKSPLKAALSSNCKVSQSARALAVYSHIILPALSCGSSLRS